MAGTVTQLSKLSGVPDAIYTQAEAYIRQLMVEGHPDRNFRIGSSWWWSLVIPAAQVAGVNLENAALILDSMFLKAVRENAANADPDLVELLLSNYFITRTSASFSSGNVTVVVNKRANYVIPVGTVFTANGYRYLVENTFYVYKDAGQVSLNNDRLLYERADGNFQYTIPVTAEDIGTAPFVSQGTALEMEAAPAEVVTATAASDIDGGADEESYSSLIDRVPETLAVQTFGGRNSIASLIIDNFPGTKVATTGMGDAEMHRDTHNREGVSTGGMTDVFVVTQQAIGTQSLSLVAELVDPLTKQWKVVIPDTYAPGVYNALGARQEGSVDDYQRISSIDRGYYLEDDDRPFIFNGMEAAFSPYQRLTVYFIDSSRVYSSLSAGDTSAYEVVVQKMPLVQEISSFLTAGDRVDPVTDVLVRGAIPCTTNISMQIRLLDGDYEEDIDVQGLKAALVAKIFTLGFDYGILSVSNVMDIAHDYLSGRSDVGGTTVTLRGQIIAPSGDVLTFNDGREIRIPNRPDIQVSPKTTVFLTDTSRIDIQFTRVED